MSLPGRLSSLTQRDAMTTIGLVLSGAWLFMVGLFWLLAPGGEGGAGGVVRLVAVMGVVLPLAMIWIAIAMGRAIVLLRAEARDLRARLVQMRQMIDADGDSGGDASGQGGTVDDTAGDRPADDQGTEDHRVGYADTATRAAGGFAPSDIRAPQAGTAVMPAPQILPTLRGAVTGLRARPAPEGRQQAMRFDAPTPVSVDVDTLIRALNFPDGPDDVVAVTALRNALRDHDNSRLLRATQDVITLLAGQDIYMDDLSAEPAPPFMWRQFAQGARGGSSAIVGATHHPEAVQIAADLLRRDEIFRDAAHHFLRHFDLMLTRICADLDDAQIAALARTRSARAFMILGRAAGVFG